MSAGNNQWVAWMRNLRDPMHPECIARVFIDGRERDYDEIWILGPEDIEAIEVYRDPVQAPDFAKGGSHYGYDELCGIVIVWTKW
jgi:hypothetical protein